MAGNDEAARGPAGHYTGSGGVLNVRNGKYAVGLVWEAVTDQSKPILNQAREGAHRNGADLLCIRKPNRVQYGLGSTKVGHTSGMPPLASVVAQTIAGSFIAAFETEAGYYLVASRDDQILPGCDRLIADKNEAIDTFADLFYSATWDQQIAPKDFGIEGPLNTTLDVAVGGLSPKAKLQPASSRGLFIRIGIFVLLAALLFGAYSYYQGAIQQAEADRVTQENIRKRAAEDAARAAKAPDAPYPWDEKQVGILALNGCVEAILAANVSAAGWTPQTVTCDGASVTAALKRSGGTVNWALATLGESTPKPRMHWDRDSITASWPIRAVATYPKGTQTKPVLDMTRYLNAQFDELFQVVNTKATTVIPPPPNQRPANNAGPLPPVVPPYGMLAISFNTSQNPKEYSKILAAIPVLVLGSVKLDIASGVWTIEGNAYEQLPRTDQARPQGQPSR